MNIFNNTQRILSTNILNNKHSKLSDLNGKEIQELAIVWCYYSAKIEGNTYTYVDRKSVV